MKEHTIEVIGHMGKSRRINRAEFVQRWGSQAADLLAVGVNVRATVEKLAGEEWDRIWKRENQE